MNGKSISEAKNPDLRSSMTAIRRASALTREVAIQTDSGIVVVVDGIIVEPAAVTSRFRPTAQEEFIESALYYEAAGARLGQQFRDAVKVGVDRVAANPEVGIARQNMRQVVVEGFPFNIVYRIVDADRKPSWRHVGSCT